MSQQPCQETTPAQQRLDAQLHKFMEKPQRQLLAEITVLLEGMVTGSERSLPMYLFESAVAQSPLAISITDRNANILYCNESFTTVTGYSHDEVVGHNESILSYKSTPKRVYQEMWEALSADQAWKGMLVNKRKDGERYLAEVLIAPVVDAQGAVSHYLGIHQDSTELHALQQRVDNQKALIESVVDAAPDAMAVLDPQLKVLLDNHAYKKLVGDLRGKEPAVQLLDAMREADPQFSVLLKQQRGFSDREVACRRARGSEQRWFSCSGVWFTEQSTAADDYFTNQHAPYLLLMVHEITTQKHQQEAIRHNAMRALMAEEALHSGMRETLSAAIYKLQEPLNMLHAAVAMIGRRNTAEMDAPLLQMLQQVSEQSADTLQLLQQVMPAAEEGSSEPVNINQLIHEVLQVNTERLLTEGIVVSWRPDSDLPSVNGNTRKLRGLFSQLLDNAIEAIAEAAPAQREIEIATHQDAEWLQLAFSDSGNGIDEALRYKVFEPFFTTKSGQKRPHTGMGLTLAQDVINAHAGTIEIDSDFRGGCRIQVRLPLSRNGKLNGESV
jgi:nitrogen fixation negative regulator NifL